MFCVVSYCQHSIAKAVGKASQIRSATYVISLLKWLKSTRHLPDLSFLREQCSQNIGFTSCWGKNIARRTFVCTVHLCNNNLNQSCWNFALWSFWCVSISPWFLIKYLNCYNVTKLFGSSSIDTLQTVHKPSIDYPQHVKRLSQPAYQLILKQYANSFCLKFSRWSVDCWPVPFQFTFSGWPSFNPWSLEPQFQKS